MVVRIGYNRIWGPAMLLLAAINIALFVLGGWLLQLFIAVMFGTIGILYLVRPFLVIDDTTIEAKSLIGYSLRKFHHGGFAELQVERAAIVMAGKQRLRLPRLMISGSDLNKLAEKVREARAERAASAT